MLKKRNGRTEMERLNLLNKLFKDQDHTFIVIEGLKAYYKLQSYITSNF